MGPGGRGCLCVGATKGGCLVQGGQRVHKKKYAFERIQAMPHLPIAKKNGNVKRCADRRCDVAGANQTKPRVPTRPKGVLFRIRVLCGHPFFSATFRRNPLTGCWRSCWTGRGTPRTLLQACSQPKPSPLWSHSIVLFPNAAWGNTILLLTLGRHESGGSEPGVSEQRPTPPEKQKARSGIHLVCSLKSVFCVIMVHQKNWVSERG